MVILWISSFLAIFASKIETVAGQWGDGGGGGFGMAGGGGGGGMAGGGGGATCTFDLKCFNYSPGCSIMNRLKPFFCTGPMSCEDCLAQCLKAANGLNPLYCCRAVDYNANTGTCSLFSRAANPRDFQKVYGHNYFQPTFYPGCGAATSSSTAAPAAICHDGETAKLIAVKDYAVDNVNGKDVPGVDADACGKACLTGKLPDGSGFPCKAAQFKDGKCTLSQDAPKSEGEQKKSEGSTFFRLYCFPSDLVKGCPDVFLEMPQKILVGQNKQTVDKSTLDECIKACLTSQKDNGFTCKSAIFYYNDKKLNCILNVESSKTKPDLFTEAAPGDVEVYFETGCGGGQKFSDSPMPKTKDFEHALKDLPEHGGWELWYCHHPELTETRFQRCPKKNSRHCPKETRPCGGHSKSSVATHTSGKKGGDDKLVNMPRKRDQPTS